MSRFPVLLVTLVLAVVVFAPIPAAEATHQWGHRYMVYGRILDDNGDPLQLEVVTITVDTTKQQDPVIVVPTRCDGVYYSLKDQGNTLGGDVGLEGPVMHIHSAELPSDGEFRVGTDYGTHAQQVRGEMHRSTANFQVDAATERRDSCAGQPAWDTQYIVQGRIQIDEGATRLDQMTLPNQGITHEVDVTLETVNNGTLNMTVTTNAYGDYEAIFDNVTVEEGAKVTATWEDTKRSGKVDETYRMTEVNIVTGESGGAGQVFLWIVGGVLIVGVVIWGGGKVRAAMESKQIQQSATRKRANK